MAKLTDVLPAPDTRANQPAATAVSPGTLYSVSDEGNKVEQSDGAAWVHWAGGVPAGVILADGSVAFAAALDMGSNPIGNLDDPTTAQQAATRAYVDGPITEPSDSGFAWVNQGTSTLTAVARTLALRGIGTAVAGLVCRVKSAPATPYVISAKILGNPLTKSFLTYGLLFRDSASGKIAVLRVVAIGASGMLLNTDKYNSATSYNAQYTSYACYPINWLRIADDGTSRKCSFSTDGRTWVEVHSVGRTDFLTADQIGFFVEPVNQATPNLDAIATVESWLQT